MEHIYKPYLDCWWIWLRRRHMWHDHFRRTLHGAFHAAVTILRFRHRNRSCRFHKVQHDHRDNSPADCRKHFAQLRTDCSGRRATIRSQGYRYARHWSDLEHLWSRLLGSCVRHDFNYRPLHSAGDGAQSCKSYGNCNRCSRW